MSDDKTTDAADKAYEALLIRWRESSAARKASQEALRACLTGLTALRATMVAKDGDGAV